MSDNNNPDGWDSATQLRIDTDGPTRTITGTTPVKENGAIVSPNQWYRYLLWRQWNRDRPCALFIMLNPSTADAAVNDHTIRKCIGFAKRMGFGGIEVVNLFALRATKPSDLIAAHRRGVDVIGPDNEVHIVRALRAERNTIAIAAWGAALPDTLDGRIAILQGMLGETRRSLTCLGTTKSGAPRHPLMVPYSMPLTRYEL